MRTMLRWHMHWQATTRQQETPLQYGTADFVENKVKLPTLQYNIALLRGCWLQELGVCVLMSNRTNNY